jgi:hypothetical protein
MKTKIAPLIAFLLLVIGSCSDDEIDGVGPVVTQELQLASFNSIDFQISGAVTIKQGPVQQVLVTSQANIIERMNTKVVNDTWEIRFGSGNYTYDRMEIDITVPNISQVILAGSGSMMVEAFENQSNVEIALLGSGNIVIEQLDGSDRVTVDLGGSGTINVLRESSLLNDLEIFISGSGSFQGFSLPTKRCITTITGSGNTEITVNETLEGNISGSGSIFYKGQPQISIDITGSGQVVDTN